MGESFPGGYAPRTTDVSPDGRFVGTIGYLGNSVSLQVIDVASGATETGPLGLH